MPLFIKITLKDKVKNIVDVVLADYEQLFLIDLSVSESNKIIITLDGDTGVNLQDCITISRAVEQELDKDELDFSLEVASAGVSSPLKFVRQYKKNIGRKLKVQTISNEVIEALLTDADEEAATFSWKAREPKKIGKGKETVEKILRLPYGEIKESIVLISF